MSPDPSSAPSGARTTQEVSPDARILYDWNSVGEGMLRAPTSAVEVYDETLRDGLQSPSVHDPPVESKLELLSLMDGLGIDAADIGLPAAHERNLEDVVRLGRFLSDEGLAVQAACAARTVVSDVESVVEASQRAGIAMQPYVFIGSSPIRELVEGWDLDLMVRCVRDAVARGTREGLEVTFVTEDTVRAHPEHLRVLFRAALEEGACGLCLCDTVGHATPDGVRNLVRWVRQTVDAWGFSRVRLDWHGHSDRGLSLVNALAAATAGATRIHATALGIGERVGNTPMDLLLVNLWLLGWIDRELPTLMEYGRKASEALGVEVPFNYPVLGRDAFRTATGVHAAAIAKAMAKDEVELADRVYSGVPARVFGRRQEIEVGPMSGHHNAVEWLRSRGLAAGTREVEALLAAAKTTDHTLTEEECRAVLTRLAGSSEAGKGS